MQPGKPDYDRKHSEWRGCTYTRQLLVEQNQSSKQCKYNLEVQNQKWETPWALSLKPTLPLIIGAADWHIKVAHSHIHSCVNIEVIMNSMMAMGWSWSLTTFSKCVCMYCTVTTCIQTARDEYIYRSRPVTMCPRSPLLATEDNSCWRQSQNSPKILYCVMQHHVSQNVLHNVFKNMHNYLCNTALGITAQDFHIASRNACCGLVLKLLWLIYLNLFLILSIKITLSYIHGKWYSFILQNAAFTEQKKTNYLASSITQHCYIRPFPGKKKESGRYLEAVVFVWYVSHGVEEWAVRRRAASLLVPPLPTGERLTLLFFADKRDLPANRVLACNIFFHACVFSCVLSLQTRRSIQKLLEWENNRLYHKVSKNSLSAQLFANTAAAAEQNRVLLSRIE